jgi:hypothetical protein
MLWVAQGEERARREEDKLSPDQSVLLPQVLLAQLLCRYDIDANLCFMWINRIYALIVRAPWSRESWKLS